MRPSHQASPGTADAAETTISIRVNNEIADRLRVLANSDEGLPDLSAVMGKLIDHVQQGVYRPGAWERDWLCQAFCDEWLERVEPDPESPYFDRPRALPDQTTPAIDREAGQ